MTSHIPLNSSSEPRNGSLFPSNSHQLETFQDIEPLNVDAGMPKQDQYRCFFGKELGSLESPKEEHNLLQPLFNQWPKMRDLGSHIDDHRSNKNLVTATQLSMSSPTASNFFARSAQSPNGISLSFLLLQAMVLETQSPQFHFEVKKKKKKRF